MASADPQQVLVSELREHALVIGDVTLSSGKKASYYVDAKRALLLPAAFRATGELVAAAARELGATAVGGMTMGADPIACAALAAPDGERLRAFFLVVEDVVTTGGSTVRALERVIADGLDVRGTVCVVDRVAGGREAIEEAGGAPFRALVTIDELYPDRPDRG